MTDKASSTTLYPDFSKFQKRSTGKNPSKSNRNITELEKHDIWEEKRKNRMNWSSAKRRETKGRDSILQIYESLLAKSKRSVSPCPQLSGETERFIKQQRRFRKTLLGGVAERVWCEGTGEKGKRNTKSKLLKGKTQWVNRQTVWGVCGVSPSLSPNCHQKHNYTTAFHWLVDLSEVCSPDIGFYYKQPNMDALSPPIRTLSKVKTPTSSIRQL